jgi:phosphate transport system substrate-binding protein
LLGWSGHPEPHGHNSEDFVKLMRHGAVLALAAAGALALAGCGSENNAPAGAPGSSAAAMCGGKPSLKASGSSAQANAMTRFVNAYESTCPGHSLDYTSSGSGAGVNEFLGGQTDFGGSDSPLSEAKGEPRKAQQRCGSPAWNLPTVFGPIAITYNVPGVTSLALDGPTAAKIFSGQITDWSDPAIKALNPDVNLPGQKIVVIFRSDESGTTDNFQQYLQAASKDAWTKGAGKAFAGGVGEGAKGNEGTSAAIKSTPGSITYNEWSFAKQQNLNIAKILNSGGGAPVELTAANVGKAIEGAKIKGQGNDLVLDLASIYSTTTQGAYPIALATYEIVCSKYADPATAQAVKAFLTVAAGRGQNGLDGAGYIPLPDSFKQKITAAIAAIQ